MSVVLQVAGRQVMTTAELHQAVNPGELASQTSSAGYQPNAPCSHKKGFNLEPTLLPIHRMDERQGWGRHLPVNT